MDVKNMSQLSKRLVAEPDDYMHSLRTNLYMYIGEKDITLQQISDEADIPISTLKTLCYGDAKDCRISTVIKLARVFHVSVDELIGSGTITSQTCESLQLMRTLPESFTYFVRWIIRFYRDMLIAHPVKEKAVEIMKARCSGEGNLIVTSDMEVSDISDYAPEVRTKIYMGIKIPCGNYEPYYFSGDILYVAHDRRPREDEAVVVCIAGCMWILKSRREVISSDDKRVITRYYTLRDDKYFASGDDIDSVIGYVVKVRRG